MDRRITFIPSCRYGVRVYADYVLKTHLYVYICLFCPDKIRKFNLNGIDKNTCCQYVRCASTARKKSCAKSSSRTILFTTNVWAYIQIAINTNIKNITLFLQRFDPVTSNISSCLFYVLLILLYNIIINSRDFSRS